MSDPSPVFRYIQELLQDQVQGRIKRTVQSPVKELAMIEAEQFDSSSEIRAQPANLQHPPKISTTDRIRPGKTLANAAVNSCASQPDPVQPLGIRGLAGYDLKYDHHLQFKLLKIEILSIVFGIHFNLIEDVLPITSLQFSASVSWHAGRLDIHGGKKTIIDLAQIVIPIHRTQLRQQINTPPKYALQLANSHFLLGCDDVHCVAPAQIKEFCACRGQCHHEFLAGVYPPWSGAILDIPAILRIFAGDGGRELA